MLGAADVYAAANQACIITPFILAGAMSPVSVMGTLTQVLAEETSGVSRVRVNAINPGPTRTAMRRTAYPAEAPDSAPLPEAITAAYVCLLGPGGRGMSGLSVDAQAPRP